MSLGLAVIIMLCLASCTGFSALEMTKCTLTKPHFQFIEHWNVCPDNILENFKIVLHWFKK